MVTSIYDSYLARYSDIEKEKAEKADKAEKAKKQSQNSIFQNTYGTFFGNIFGESTDDYWNNFLESLMYGNLNLGKQSFLGSGSACFAKVNNSKTDFKKLNANYDSNMGNKLAETASQHQSGGVGLCLKYVREDLEKLGITSSGLGASACESADKLVKNNRFSQVSVAKSDLANLPAGCLVIFDRGDSSGLSSMYGHILITDGKGNGISDHSENLRDTVGKYSDSYVVLVPSKSKKGISKVG